MSLIRPFRGLRPAVEMAAAVIAPPYDVLTSAEARLRAAGKPFSFLHVSKAEIDLPASTDVYSASVYAQAAMNFKSLRDAGVLKSDSQDVYYIYRLSDGAHAQTGLMAIASVAAYEDGRIRKHEFTRHEKEDDRVRQIEAVNAQTGPVLLIHPDDQSVDKLLAQASSGRPEVEIIADDGVCHALWVVRDRALIERITNAFEGVASLYIADGHHRAAAAARVAASRRGSIEAASNRFLAVIFPAREMKISSYNRLVKDLNGLSSSQFLYRLAESFDVMRSLGPFVPNAPGVFSVYLPGCWYRAVINRKYARVKDIVKRLDVSLLADYVLAPILDIEDQRRDARIDFVGGIRGLTELERRVDNGEMAVAFAMHPTQIADLMAVSDSGRTMPPKSTWFEPKLADGMVSHMLR